MDKAQIKRRSGFMRNLSVAAMLPVAVLPVAGLLLGLGAADIYFIPAGISEVLEQAGNAVFSMLPILFLLAVSVTFVHDGSIVISSIVGYSVFLHVMGVIAGFSGTELATVHGIETLNMGVLGGILMGFVVVGIYHRFHNIRLPEFLNFFGGRRFVPIMTAVVAIGLGIVFSFLWPFFGRGLDSFGNFIVNQARIIGFPVFFFVERLLIPTGLHHITNAIVFFQVGNFLDPTTGAVVSGEIPRYFAGDPTAGNLAGGYLYKMWGLCGAAVAMWATARPENKKIVGGLMLSAALTAFITGITEPIEFSFLFVAPLLYGVHAILGALSYVVTILFDIRHSITFSHGLVDYILLYPLSSNGWMLSILGPLMAVLYFFVFRTLILVFNFQTPGRGALLATLQAEDAIVEEEESVVSEIAHSLVKAFGGAANIVHVDACITRLRIDVVDASKADKDLLTHLGAKGVYFPDNAHVQAVFGTMSDIYAGDMRKVLKK